MKAEKTNDFAGVDLFGNAIEPLRDRRGRPSFKKSKQNQDFVSVRSAAGWTQEAIANALGCDAKTLRLNFSRELSAGALMIEGLCLDVLLQKVRVGHTPSVNALQARLDRISTPPAPKKKGAPAEPAKGKKQIGLEAAGKPLAEYSDLYARLGQQ